MNGGTGEFRDREFILKSTVYRTRKVNRDFADVLATFILPPD
jgi:hypothetical protein